MTSIKSQRDILSKNGFALSKTYGVSMRPLIWGGDHFVALAPLDKEPTVGDLLMFRIDKTGGEEKNILHRLVEIRRDGSVPVYITRGDNCVACERVRREEIIGRVVEIHRLSRWHPWHILPMKRIRVSGLPYRAYSRFWSLIWPLRRLAYILRNRSRRLFRNRKSQS